MTGGKKLKLGRRFLNAGKTFIPGRGIGKISASERMGDSMADPQMARIAGGASEAHPGYTHKPRDTRDRQSSRFDHRVSQR